ncbi:adventurous gliding motility protein AgmC [Myxococcus stipitatus]|uniref:adventurous gliding motility protein AgmC n=1 Tax=Myxococcus stipitatus TaxID=83455 RepID=UPI0030D24FFE
MRLLPRVLILLLLSSVAQAELDSFGVGTGRDGALSVTSRRTINTAMRMPLGALRGEKFIEVEAATAPADGSLLLIHQTQGFSSSTPSGTTGPTSPGGVGSWEMARVKSVTAGNPMVIQLTAPLVNNYDAPGSQAVTVPEYTTVSVTSSGSLVAPPWDGSSGGIVAFLANGAVTHNGSINADGAGFRGGVFTKNTSRSNCTGDDLPTAQGGAFKGEGLVVTRYGSASGRGNLVNAGGSGICKDSGGGGGGHRGVGGIGGRTSATDGARDMGGKGGVEMGYTVVYSFLFGGGGGAGEGDSGDGSSGGAGGGAVLVRAMSISGNGTFSANGAAAVDSGGTDGAGGGGAGGAVIVRATGALGCTQAHVMGGAGGSSPSSSAQTGPGGGGAGGALLLHASSVVCPGSHAGGAAGAAASAGNHGATAGAIGEMKLFLFPYMTPTTPVITEPVANTDVSLRPTIRGVADPGMRVIISVDGVKVAEVGAGSDGSFVTVLDPPFPELSAGAHSVSAVSESMGAYSRPSSQVPFNAMAPAPDAGPGLQIPIIVVPTDGEVMGPTPYIAGVAGNARTVGLYIDNRPEVIVPADSMGRFRYDIPANEPLEAGPHKVNAHGHDVDDNSSPSSPDTRFEVVLPDPDAGSPTPDAGNSDAGSSGPDAGSGDGGSVVTRDVPVLVVPFEGEVVDPTPLFAGVAQPGVSVSLEVDGTRVATVVADTTGAFRHTLAAEQALTPGAHGVSASMLNSESGVAGTRSPDTGFQVRGPTALDVGCGGCGASPTSAAAAWVLLIGGAAFLRQRRR